MLRNKKRESEDEINEADQKQASRLKNASSLKDIEYREAKKSAKSKGAANVDKKKDADLKSKFMKFMNIDLDEAKEVDSQGQYFLVENKPYYFSPSFLHHNGKVSTIVQLYARQGSNRNLSYTSIIDLIPVNTLDNVSMQFIVQDTLIKGDEKKRLIRKNARGGKEATKDSLENGTKEDTENQAAIEIKMSELDDYNEYELILDRADPVVVFKVILQITGNTEEEIDEQIAILNTLLDQRHEGLKWDSLGGDQYARFTNLFDRVPRDRFSMTSTSENYAGLNFSVNAGLNDDEGLPIGIDALSLSSSSSYFDMNNSTRSQAIISIPKSSYLQRYARDNEASQVSASSIFAQAVANHAHMNGHRVHHIVLNDFNYAEEDLFFRPIESVKLFDFFDVSKMTINPLQGFGDIEKVVSIYGRLVQKIVNIFDVLNNLELTQEEKAVILSIVDQFYFNQDLWIADAEIYPKRTRIVGIQKPETYPTMGTMINEFSNLATRAARENRELKADRIDTLGAILNQAITSNMGILGRPTSIQESSAPQVYYSFKNVDSTQIKQVQFLNIIDYIIYTAKRGDIIILHGCDKLWKTTLTMVSESIKAAQESGIRFVFCFDSIKSEDSRIDSMADIFNMQGVYYNDLDADVDWSAIGKCLPPEVEMYEKALNSALSMTIRQQMMSKAQSQVLLHRHVGDVNNFVYLNVLI